MSSKWLNLKACDGGKLKKGPWTFEEDIRLLRYIKLYGPCRWSALAKVSGLQRCGKSCRLRWVNYLRPDLKRGSITPDEERLILDLHARLGNRWSLIAEKIPGRTDNEIKNFWRSRIRKRPQPSQYSDDHESVDSSSLPDHIQLLSPPQTGNHDNEKTLANSPPNLAVFDSSTTNAKLHEQSCEATTVINNAEFESFCTGSKWEQDEAYYRCPWLEQDALAAIVYQFYLGIQTDDISASSQAEVTTMSTDSSGQSDGCLDLEAYGILWNNQFQCNSQY